MGKRAVAVSVLSMTLALASVAGAKSNITLTTTWSADQVSAFLVEFKKRHPDISVSMTAAPSPERVWAQIASGSPPDVFYVRGTDAQTYIRAGVLEPLDKYIKASRVNMSDFIAEGLKPYLDKKGATYALPYDWCPIMAFFNRTHLKSAGMPDLSDDTSLDDMNRYIRKLRVTRGSNVSRWGLSAGVDSWPFEGTWLKGFGGRIYNDDETQVLVTSREAVKALAFCRDVYQEGLIGGSFPKSAAIRYTGTWDINIYNSLRDDWDIAPLPKGPVDRFGSAMGSGYCIAKNSKNKAAAWTLLNELIGPMGMEMIWAKGTTPSRRSGLKYFNVLHPKLNVKYVETAMDNSWAGRPLLPPGEMTTNTVTDPILYSLISGKVSPEQAASNFKSAVEALWKARRKSR